MLALFIALSLALMILTLAEVWPGSAVTEAGPIAPLTSRRRAGPKAVAAQNPAPKVPPKRPPEAIDEDAIILDRLARLLIDSTAPQTSPPVGDLPRITGFRPGDVIEVELDGPLPHPEDLRFEQAGGDATLILDGAAALIVEGVPAHSLRPANLRFRTSRAA